MIDRINMPTLFLATTVVQIVAALLILCVLKMYGREPAVRWWAASYLLYAASALNYAISQGQPNYVGIAFGNGLAMLAAACLYSGVAVFLGSRKLSLTAISSIILAALIVISYFATAIDSLGLRNLIYSLVTGFFYVLTIQSLLFSQKQRPEFLHYAISTSLALFIVTLSARALELLFFEHHGALFNNSLIQVIWMVGVQITTFVTAFGFVLLISTRMAASLRYMGSHDLLTGALKRRKFSELARELLTTEKELIYSLFVIDLDNFKMINDQYGHDAGDRALSTIANKVRYLSPEAALFGRAGGDEFWLLFSTEHQSAESFGNVLAQAISNLSIQVDAEQFKISISIGACEFRACEFIDDAKGIYAAADSALFRAKSAGRNCVRTESYRSIGYTGLSTT